MSAGELIEEFFIILCLLWLGMSEGVLLVDAVKDEVSMSLIEMGVAIS